MKENIFNLINDKSIKFGVIPITKDGDEVIFLVKGINIESDSFIEKHFDILELLSKQSNCVSVMRNDIMLFINKNILSGTLNIQLK